MLSMLCVVVVFGAHSLVDWTWYVPGDACVALLCAGWLAGRGPLDSATRAGSRRRAADRIGASLRATSPMSAAVAGAAVIAALLAAWVQWQPQRSVDSSQQALALLATDPAGGDRPAQTAVARDPLSVQALFTLATIQQATGQPALARATLQRAVRLQPSNPQTWLHLGEYDLPPAARTPEAPPPTAAGSRRRSCGRRST